MRQFSHVHSIVTIGPTRCFHLHLPTTMQGPSKETVQGKRKFRDKLKDGVKGIFKLSLSRAPSPQRYGTVTPYLLTQGESSKTGGNAGVGKHLRLDCQEVLMSETNIQRGRGPTQRLQLCLSMIVEIHRGEVA